MSLLHLNTSYEKLQDLVIYDFDIARFSIYKILITNNLNAVEKREVLVVILQIIRNLDDATLIKAWQQSIARTRLFFKLLEECISHFEVSTLIF
jgi:hypothetical protein